MIGIFSLIGRVSLFGGSCPCLTTSIFSLAEENKFHVSCVTGIFSLTAQVSLFDGSCPCLITSIFSPFEENAFHV